MIHLAQKMPQLLRLSLMVVVAFILLAFVLLRQWTLEERIGKLGAVHSEKRGMTAPSRLAAPNHEENLVVFYNRVPKSGSTTLMGVVYSLAKRNRFHCLHLNTTRNDHYMSPADQYKFAWNVTTWRSRLPAFYHGHVNYINFQRYGAPPPLFIQLLRDPIDRMVSYFYFLRYGDDFRPNLLRSRMGSNMTFDQCVARNHRDCLPKNWWIQVPFFCGMAPECKIPGNTWALQQAKRNLINNYFVVGVTEQIPEYIAVLEASLPRFFKDATKHYLTGGQMHLRKTKKKLPPKRETLEKIKATKEWQMENELYLLAVSIFNDIKARTIKSEVNALGEEIFVPKKKAFMYEKIVGP